MTRHVMALGLLLLLILIACQPQQKVDIAAEENQIKDVLNTYVTSIENEDMALYGSVVAHDSDMVNFGGFGEPIIGWDSLKAVIERQNEALSDTKIEVKDLRIHVGECGKLAWATDLWNLQAMMGENQVEMNIRCTWVLEKRDGKWLIVHFHKSMAQG